MRKQLAFLRDYGRYLTELKIRLCIQQWLRGLLQEIVTSRVNQLSIVLGVIGVTGLLVAAFSYMIANVIVPVLAFLGGVIAFAAITMCSFYSTRYSIAAVPDDIALSLDRLLNILMKNGAMTSQGVSRSIDLSSPDADKLLSYAEQSGWICKRSGTWCIEESMKPIVRSRIKEKERKLHEAKSID